MDAPSLSAAEIKALDQTRQRLAQLKSTLEALHRHILTSNPLPSWSHLQQVATVISQNVSSVSQALSTHHDLFSAMVAHPLPTYPAQTQEVLLQELLRKKLQPHVEDWVAEARAVASADSAGVDADSGHAGLREVWEWAGQAANEQARRHVWGGNYTLEEREGGIENVVTGLRRRLKADRADGDDGEGDESGSESDEGDGDELEVVGVRRKSVGGVEFDLRRNNEHMLEVGGAAMPIGDVLRYMMTGKRAKG